jgi:UDP-glucose 4-epimerase
MEIKGKRFLVTGGAGFIGSHVVQQLLAKDAQEVIVYDNFARGSFSNLEDCVLDSRLTINPFGGDIRDTDILNRSMVGIDGVFHLAAMWLLHCKDFPRTAFDVNIQGTFNVLEACVNNGVSRLVYSSSASVYGDALQVPMTEEHPFNNRNFYGATKIAGEAMVRAFFDRYDLPYVGLRYMNVYGPNQDQTAAYTGVIPIMLNKIDANQTPEVNGDGSQAYDFITVQDTARCNILAMQADSVDEFYNVATGIQTSIHELCSLILKLQGSDLQVSYKPYPLEDARRLVQNRIGSTQKASHDLGFDFQTDLESGLIDLIKWRQKSARN